MQSTVLPGRRIHGAPSSCRTSCGPRAPGRRSPTRRRTRRTSGRRGRTGCAGNTANPFWAFRATEVAPRRRGPGVRVAEEQRRDLRQHRRSPVRGRRTATWWPRSSRGGSGWSAGTSARPSGSKWLRTLPDGRLSLVGAQSHVLRGDPLPVRPAIAARAEPGTGARACRARDARVAAGDGAARAAGTATRSTARRAWWAT